MSHPDGARPAAAGNIRPVANGTPTRTPWIWMVVALPLVTAITNATTPASSYIPIDPAQPAVPSGSYLAQQSILGLIFAATVIFAYLDSRALKRLGYARPFGWGWAFLGPVVYVLGRVFVVWRRSGRGLEVLWIFLTVLAVSFVVSAAKVAEVVGVFVDQLAV